MATCLKCVEANSGLQVGLINRRDRGLTPKMPLQNPVPPRPHGGRVIPKASIGPHHKCLLFSHKYTWLSFSFDSFGNALTTRIHPHPRTYHAVLHASLSPTKANTRASSSSTILRQDPTSPLAQQCQLIHTPSHLADTTQKHPKSFSLEDQAAIHTLHTTAKTLPPQNIILRASPVWDITEVHTARWRDQWRK